MYYELSEGLVLSILAVVSSPLAAIIYYSDLHLHDQD